MISVGGHTTDSGAAQRLAHCRAQNFPFLSSIAWCMHLFCDESVHASKIEKFWETIITGDLSVLPEWSYGEVMANITQPPTMMAPANRTTVLNMTMLVSKSNFDAVWTTLYYFYRETVVESYFG
jgi:hypothetical protein